MNANAERIRVIASAAVTWLVAASVFVSASAPAVVSLLAEGDAATVTEWSVRTVAWLLGAAAIIRRVTPVEPSARGILNPQPDIEHE